MMQFDGYNGKINYRDWIAKRCLISLCDCRKFTKKGEQAKSDRYGYISSVLQKLDQIVLKNTFGVGNQSVKSGSPLSKADKYPFLTIFWTNIYSGDGELCKQSFSS